MAVHGACSSVLLLLLPKPPGGEGFKVLSVVLLGCSTRPSTTRARPGTAARLLLMSAGLAGLPGCPKRPELRPVLLLLDEPGGAFV